MWNKYYIILITILLHACEIWGLYLLSANKCMSNHGIDNDFKCCFEIVHLTFLRFCLGVHTKTNIVLLMEIEEYPLALKMFNLSCKNWLRIVHLQPNSLSYVFFCNAENIHTWIFHWLTVDKDICYHSGYTTIWKKYRLIDQLISDH